MLETINEEIQVGVVFKQRRTRPVWFIWKGRQYTIQEITYTWSTQEGESRIQYFAASDGTHLFELSLDCHALIWRLLRVHIDG
jgi:hypothetical protein